MPVDWEHMPRGMRETAEFQARQQLNNGFALDDRLKGVLSADEEMAIRTKWLRGMLSTDADGQMQRERVMITRTGHTPYEVTRAANYAGTDYIDLSGGWVWIWNINKCDGGNIARIAARLKAAGARGVILKITDGSRTFFQNGIDPSRVVKALQAEGIDVITWSYCYGNPTAEYVGMINVLQNCVPYAHFLDVEQEVEDSTDPANWALTLVSDLQTANICPIGYAPLPIIRYHTRLPYYQLSVTLGLPMSPQLYYVGLQMTPADTVNTFVADMAQFELNGPPILPSYEDSPLAGAASSDADADAFAQLALQQGWQGVAVWTYESMDDGAWRRFTGIVAALTPIPAPTPDPPAPNPPAPNPPAPVGDVRTAYAQIGANVTTAALDPALSDDDAASALTDAARDIYALTWPNTSIPEGTVRL